MTLTQKHNALGRIRRDSGVIRSYLSSHFHKCVMWGIVLQCFGGLVPLAPGRPALALLGWLMLLTGTVLMLIGFAYYAQAKGRSPAWSLLALASIVGWLILLSLEVRTSAKPTANDLMGRQ